MTTEDPPSQIADAAIVIGFTLRTVCALFHLTADYLERVL